MISPQKSLRLASIVTITFLGTSIIVAEPNTEQKTPPSFIGLFEEMSNNIKKQLSNTQEFQELSKNEQQSLIQEAQNENNIRIQAFKALPKELGEKRAKRSFESIQQIKNIISNMPQNPTDALQYFDDKFEITTLQTQMMMRLQNDIMLAIIATDPDIQQRLKSQNWTDEEIEELAAKKMQIMLKKLMPQQPAQ